MLPLSDHPEARAFERADCALVIDARDARHLHRNLDLADVFAAMDVI